MSAIKVHNLRKQFVDFVAVDDVSFEIPFGQITALLGANGAGKSTTLNMIAGIMIPTSGSIEIGGLDLMKHNKEIKNKLGYLTSEMALYATLSVKENLELFAQLKGLSKSKTQGRIDELCHLFKLDTFINKHFKELSSGQKQRALIANSILHDPEILIFDEVTASLDIMAAKSIMDYLKSEKARGKAVIFATHILSEVEYISDRILMVKKGRLVEETTYPDLIKNTGATTLTEAFFSALKDEPKNEAA
jgi:sodium transport system ATP-binding protein